MAEIYLASRSSRRRELLNQIGVRFETLLLRVEPRKPTDVDETQRESESADSYVERIAREKAVCGRRVLLARSQVFRPVLAADTVVVVDGEVLGKPTSREQASQFLRRLAGRTHQVRTTVALVASSAPNSDPLVATSVSHIKMRTISDEEIQNYCASNEPMDKAGAYAIQGKAAIFVERLEGSYSGVVGLPLAETASLLVRAGIRLRKGPPALVSTEDILINITPQETRVAVLLAGVVQELHIERAATRGLVGNIYLGRVARVLPGMQSAFIDIGLERAAFLHVADIWEARQQPTDRPPPIERLLRQGDVTLVQVIKDPIGTKGARLSTQISLAGRMLVYLPQDPHIGVSQRIEDETERNHLRETLTRLLPAEETGGYIIRTSAEDANEDDLRADIEYLRRRWLQIQDFSGKVPAQTQLYQELSLGQRVLRDVVNDGTASVQIDSRETFVALQAFAAQYVPNVSSRLAHYDGERPLFELYQIDEEIEKALARRVDLKSGGYLIIDQTEAMTTIDVNTGGFVGTRNFDDTIFKTNLEAAQTIARQLRLRNLGGIIVLDFIDMASPTHRELVLAELKKALARDRTRMTVSQFTQLGLVEMTRKRTRESLAHVLCEPCPVCEGRGVLKTGRTVCYEILREILREARQFGDAREFRILGAQPVIDLFLEEESQSLAMLSDFIGKPISMQVESAYHQEQYDIVLM